MRLDFNENTVACSPKVREVLSRISAGYLTRYPERDPVESIVAAHLDVQAEQVALTNGVDEAIHVLFETFLEARRRTVAARPHLHHVRGVRVGDRCARSSRSRRADDLQFPFDRLLDAITPRTKIIAIANPNSPSGSIATRAQIIELAQRAPQAVVLVDEAYFHFHGETVIDLIDHASQSRRRAHVLKGIWSCGTAARSSGGPSRAHRWIRRVLSPYSVNSLALACLPPALEDTAYLDWYVSEVLAARADFEAALDAAAIRRWPSHANFILVYIGQQHAEFVRLMSAGGVLVRDRSNDPGCDGCVRITIGTREQMREAVVVLNNTLHTLNAAKEKR